MGFFWSSKKEKRRFPRMKTFDLLKCEYPAKEAAVQITNLVNISEGGLQFVCQNLFRLADRLRMTINLAELERDIPVEAKVVWICKEHRNPRMGDDLSCRVGVSFTGIADQDRAAIHDLVHQAA